MSLTTDLPKYRSDLVGDDPGDECYIDLTPEAPREETRMRFCWCPPSEDGYLPGFWLGKHLVTQAQWTALGLENRSRFTESGQQPVDNVSWDDAGDFAQRSQAVMPAGYELWLPAEAQWERACRAGQSGDFAVGSGTVLNSQLANFDGNHPHGEGSGSFDWLYRQKTVPTGSFPPNAWGLHDMHGQLWEWCAEWLDQKRGWRVLRGGSWIRDGFYCRAGYRSGAGPRDRIDSFGLRVSPSSIQTRKSVTRDE
jgi:formylglycine-generating enzyme required for sulfatase activity